MTDFESDERLRPWSPATYEIEVEGPLSESGSDGFPGMRITSRRRADQTTVTRLSGRVEDQSALTGLLNGLAELHLPILSVKKTKEM